MRFYRVAYRIDNGTSNGASWHTSMAAANRAAREAIGNDPSEYSEEPPEIEAFDIEPTKKGILRALKRHASHAENG